MITSEASADYVKRAVQIYERANRRTSGWLAVLARASLGFARNRASLAAAGITYFSIFSIFPLLVVTITALSPFVDLPIVQGALRKWLATSFPLSLEVLVDEVNSLLRTRGSLKLVALLVFLWAASGMFNAMLVSINYAWGIDNVRSKVHSRIIAIAMVTVVAVAFVLLLILLWLVRLFASLLLPFWERMGILGLPLVIQLLLIFALYKAGPATLVDRKAALIGALAASLAVELTTAVFTWYLQSDWSSYNLLYGSLGAIIGLLFWVYLSNLIVLFGAYLTEAIQTRSKCEVPALFVEPLDFSTVFPDDPLNSERRR